MTYAGTAMTLLKRATGTSAVYMYELWGLANPATGTNNVIVASPTSFYALNASSFTGIAQSNTLDVTAVGAATGSTSVTATGTTTQANDLLVDLIGTVSNATVFTPGSGQTLLQTGNFYSSNALATSYKTAVSAGSTSAGWTYTPSTSADEVWVALKAAPASISGAYTLTFQGALASQPISPLTTSSSGWSTAVTTVGSVGAPNLGSVYLNGTSTYVGNTANLVVNGALQSSSTASVLQIGSAIASGSASGTYLGLNTSTGFAGNLADLQVNGTSKFKVDAFGNTTINGTFSLTGLAPLGASTALAQLGSSLSGASSNGTYFGINASPSFTGNLLDLQNNGSRVLKVTTTNVQIGSAAGVSSPILFTLDTKNTAGDPSGSNGAQYFNSVLGRLRCFENGAWVNCTSASSQTAFSTRRFGSLLPIGTAGAVLTATNVLTPTSNGTASSSPDSDSNYVQYGTAASTGALAGVIQPFSQTQGRYRPKLTTLLRTDTAITNQRIWVALSSADLSATDATGAFATQYVGVRYSTSAGDTTWKCGSGDGANASLVDTGVTVSASTAYQITVDWSVDGTLNCSVATNGGTAATTAKTTNLTLIGSQNVNLGLSSVLATLAATVQNLKLGFIYLENN